jgi:hypothetical protein
MLKLKSDVRCLAIHQLRVNIKSLAAEAKIIRSEMALCSDPADDAEIEVQDNAWVTADTVFTT